MIQEIINRPGYVYNNPIVILIEGTGRRVAESFDGNSDAAAQLIVNYSFDCIDDDEDGICNQADPCPNISGIPGTPCDDGDPNTNNDAFDENCNCIGTPSLGFGCARIAANKRRCRRNPRWYC